MERRRVSTGTEWESQVGYSRAIRVGDTVRVAGTIAIDALAELDASADDVVATRMYVTDMSYQEAVGRAHSEVFGDVRPAATMVEVSGLAAEGAVVEVEAEALVEE